MTLLWVVLSIKQNAIMSHHHGYLSATLSINPQKCPFLAFTPYFKYSHFFKKKRVSQPTVLQSFTTIYSKNNYYDQYINGLFTGG